MVLMGEMALKSFEMQISYTRGHIDVISNMYLCINVLQFAHFSQIVKYV